MVRSNRQEKFLQLREQFPFFAFEKQEYVLNQRGLDIRFTFNMADRHRFHPEIFIPRKASFLSDASIADRLDTIVFNLGMIELISYWKAACPPKIILRPFQLDPEQQIWWKKLYFHGLGEFFYLNSIAVNMDDFVDIVNAETFAGPRSFAAERYFLDDSILIPVGGGKDSAVTLELLGTQPGSIPLIMNPRGASLETIGVKGFSDDQFLEVRRSIDPALLRLNEQGFLNGHTPFSALLAFVTVLAAIVTGRRHIALSNESSANEPTIEGTHINHQYSKSLQFESDFRGYVKQWICSDINYFSFLRPLNELQIASIFSGLLCYHPVFKSCNAGSKTDSWCGNCAKCLFTYCILSPFLTAEQLAAIFGKNLFDDESLKPVFDQLTGMADEKPFDCVGTIREVNIALCETIRKSDAGPLPYLLDYYKDTDSFSRYFKADFEACLAYLSSEHHILPEFLAILQEGLL